MSINLGLHIFPNGRVMFYDKQDFENAIQNNKELALVCLSWNGGYSHVMGADIVPNVWVDENDPSFGKDCYECYGYELRDTVLTTEQLNKFHKMIFSNGEKIYTKTGHEATAYQNHKFIDFDTKLQDCPEVMSSTINFDEYRSTVDAQRTVLYLRSSDKELYRAQVQCLIDYGILPKDAHKYADYNVYNK